MNKTIFHYVHLYYGFGKGKTTAAFGLALRAVGQGQKVICLQWLKGRLDIGEVKAAKLLSGKVKVYQFGPDHFTWDKKGDSEHKKLAILGLKFLEKIVAKEKFDLLILDEIMDAVEMKFIPKSKVIALIKKAVKKGEVVLTGHKLVPEFSKIADLVTEMKKVKHYFDKGQLAREGIEY
ncbi:cob(I)yrinic acid a,c-diamide adenosyltransferase [Patescibacteria group bacterium]|nr:cob(I)yrinic acid a,c-diamide adenosyltransferase [Patescibacteria group bacterium]